MAAKKAAAKNDIPTSFEVADAYKNYRSFMANSVEIPVENGKVTVSNELADTLKEKGYLK